MITVKANRLYYYAGGILEQLWQQSFEVITPPPDSGLFVGI